MIRKHQRLQVEISNAHHNSVFVFVQSGHSLARILFLSILPVLVNGIASHTWHTRCESASILSSCSWPGSNFHLRLRLLKNVTTQPLPYSQLFCPGTNSSADSTYECTASYQMHAMPKHLFLCHASLSLSLSVSFLSKAQ